MCTQTLLFNFVSFHFLMFFFFFLTTEGKKRAHKCVGVDHFFYRWGRELDPQREGKASFCK